VSLKDMLVAIAAITGRKAPRFQMPRLPLYPLAYFAEAAASMTGKEPFLTADALKMAKHHMFFSSDKAVRELGYAYRPYAQAVEDAILWFRKSGYVS
jgi:dihydroflavonol-4-reductase